MMEIAGNLAIRAVTNYYRGILRNTSCISQVETVKKFNSNPLLLPPPPPPFPPQSLWSNTKVQVLCFKHCELFLLVSKTGKICKWESELHSAEISQYHVQFMERLPGLQKTNNVSTAWMDAEVQPSNGKRILTKD